jgi:hypothetical protein
VQECRAVSIHTHPTAAAVSDNALLTLVDSVGKDGRTFKGSDVYFCVSAQSEHKTDAPKKAKRGVAFAAAHKVFSLDIDYGKVGHADAGYATRQEAEDALADFIRKVGLPLPTFIIHTGGGLHVHWAIAFPIPTADWQPIADDLSAACAKHGLLIDHGCTTDAAHLLRIPGTFNYKTGVPRPVNVIGGTQTCHLLDQIATPLAPYRGQTATPRSAPKNDNVFILPAAFTPEARDRVNKFFQQMGAEPDNALGAGIGAGPVNLDAVAKNCGFVADALATGGASQKEPLHTYAAVLAVFTEGGEADAHRMLSGRATYTPEAATALFERKQREVKEGTLGWVSCARISEGGATPVKHAHYF